MANLGFRPWGASMPEHLCAKPRVGTRSAIIYSNSNLCCLFIIKYLASLSQDEPLQPLRFYDS